MCGASPCGGIIGNRICQLIETTSDVSAAVETARRVGGVGAADR